jgi:Tfp pilus assembly protein PilF
MTTLACRFALAASDRRRERLLPWRKNLAETLRRRPRVLMICAVVLLAALAAGGWWAWQHFWIEGPWRQAQQAWTRNHLLVAKRYLDAGLQRAPRHTGMLLLAARVARRLSEFDAAEQYLGACEARGVDSQAVSLENILLDVQRRGVRSDIEQNLYSLAQQHPADRALIYEAMAEGYAKLMRAPAALICLNKCLDEMPENVIALRSRGAVHAQMTKFPDAVVDYRKAYRLEPDHEQGRVSFADSLYKAGLFAEALPLLEELAPRHADGATVIVALAGCRAAAGQLDAARELLDALLAKQPRHAIALLERGRLEFELDRPSEAETWLRKALAADPSDRRANHLLYQCLRLQGKEKEAQEQLAKSERVAADLRRLGEIMTETMNQRPNDPDLHCELGVLYLNNGLDRQGLHWLERALEIDPMHRGAHQALAAYYDRTGQADRAAQHKNKLR